MVTKIKAVLSPSITVSCKITLSTNNDHSSLNNLDYEHSGHTGFASQEYVDANKGSKLYKHSLTIITSDGIIFNAILINSVQDKYQKITLGTSAESLQYALKFAIPISLGSEESLFSSICVRLKQGGSSSLQGRTWTGNDSFSSLLTNSFNINFTSNGGEYCSLRGWQDWRAFQFLAYKDNASQLEVQTYGENAWYQSGFKVIAFTGGSDIANTELINWLTANGTLTDSEPSLEIRLQKYDGTILIKDLTINQNITDVVTTL